MRTNNVGILERIFGKKERAPDKLDVRGYWRMLDGYHHVFTSWNGELYESELVRAAIDARARHASKLAMVMTGTAKQTLRTQVKHQPNDLQTWSQFIYRLSTILDMKNTAFIVPVLDDNASMIGYQTICPKSWELVTVGPNLEPWLRFRMFDDERAAIELRRVGIMTKFQFRNDLFGEKNTALDETMKLIDIQRQGIEESAKNSGSYRFLARVTNFTKPDDLALERQRFDRENFQNGGGGLLLMPNTYTDIQQIKQQAYEVDADQLELINRNVYNYYGVNEDVLQNKAYGDAWSAFYEGAIEPFAVQLSEVMTRMTFTLLEQSNGSGIYFTANRLQYMTNADKLSVSTELLDRGILTINDVRAIWNLEPVEGGDERIIRGEYYNAVEKINNNEPEESPAEGDDDGDAGNA